VTFKDVQFHLLSGNAATVLNEPFSSSYPIHAKALFGNEDPVWQSAADR